MKLTAIIGKLIGLYVAMVAKVIKMTSRRRA